MLLVIREMWRRYKLGILCTLTGILGLAILQLLGLVWELEHWLRNSLGMNKRTNLLVLFPILIAIGMLIDDHQTNTEQ